MAMTDKEISVPRRARSLARAIAFLAILAALLVLALCLGDLLRDLRALVLLLFGQALPEGTAGAWLAVGLLVNLVALAAMLLFLRCAGGVFFEESRKWCVALGAAWLILSALGGVYVLIERFVLPEAFAGPVAVPATIAMGVLGLFYVSPLAVRRAAPAQVRAEAS